MKQEILTQRLEGLAILIASIVAYSEFGYSWLLFVLLILAIDVSMVGYLFNERVGAITYNIGHSLVGPIIFLALGYFLPNDLITSLSLIWFAHIGIDRLFGFGLKSTKGFKHTHLGVIK